MKDSITLLKSLQAKNGLILAAPSNKTGYDKAWVRDNIYASLGLEKVYPNEALKVVHRLLDILRKHENKIEHAIREKPKHAWQYIHARYHPETLEEFWEEWGNKQNDAVGALLWRIADFLNKGYPALRDEKDRESVKNLIDYLASVEYWKDSDNGVWEEYEEVHASSVGACLAGLKAISRYFDVPQSLIAKGEEALMDLLPRESATKDVDLALLSLIYPYNIVSKKTALAILKNIEEKLLRTRGVIRYTGDQYYNKKGEAEWTMGLPWMAIIYRQLGNSKKYIEYMKRSIDVMNEKGEFPELYFADSSEHNDNSPLGWAQSLYIVAAL